MLKKGQQKSLLSPVAPFRPRHLGDNMRPIRVVAPPPWRFSKYATGHDRSVGGGGMGTYEALFSHVTSTVVMLKFEMVGDPPIADPMVWGYVFSVAEV